MADTRSVPNSTNDSSTSSEGESVPVSKSRRNSNNDNKKVSQRKLNTNSLDSNGESEDEEINKLHKIIQDQAKELNDEKLSSRKLKQMIKLLKRETKQLKAERQEKSRDPQPSNASDSDNPPWERRKLEVRLSESEKLLREKNTHIEQLLRDCRALEQENKNYASQVQQLSQQFNECTQQLQLATYNYETLETTFKERLSTLETENNKIRVQLVECQWQKETTEENLDKISDAVDVTINRCKEIIENKEKTIEALQAKLNIYESSGLSSREKEIERLRSELVTASKEMEESARLMERFQGLHLSDGGKALTSTVKRKLKELEVLKAAQKESDRLLSERDEQVAELTRTVHRYESGIYGLGEAVKELNETREQLKIRDEHIERLIVQLNILEERIEDLALENSDIREKCDMEPNAFDLPLKKMTLSQQRDACQAEIQQLKENNMALGLENRSLKRAMLSNNLSPKMSKSRPTIEPNDKLQFDYQKACSEVIVLRKGLVEILQSVREHDGTSDVKIESPILERLVTVLNSERLFGHYDAYADIMNENSSLYGENKSLRERIRELKSVGANVGKVSNSSPSISRQSSTEKSPKIDRCVQASSALVDSGCDPHQEYDTKSTECSSLPKVNETVQTKAPERTQCALTEQVEGYQEKLCDLELQLDKVKHELHNLTAKHDANIFDWQRREMGWMNEIAQKDKRLEEYENELLAKEQIIEEMKIVAESSVADQPKTNELLSAENTDESKMRMEKELVTLKIRLEHKEQTLKRSQQFLDELRLEQLKMIEDHSQEVLNLQDTILEQQRAMHRVEQTQREIAASAASSRAVVRHLETEVDSTHHLHAQLAELTSQLETVRKQAAQWKQAAEILSKEKQTFKESLVIDHKLVVEQLKSQWEGTQAELKEQREKATDLVRQLNEERYDKQRSTLLQVLVAKLKNELDKKEKQMDFLKQLAEEMHARIEANSSPLVTSTPVPAPIQIPLPSPALIETLPKEKLSPKISDLEYKYSQLQKTADTQAKQLELSRTKEKSLQEELKEQTSLCEKLQNEKGYLSRQMVSLRNRVTRMSGEKAAAQSAPEDVCRLLRRIKDLEAQLAVFNMAEKPTDESQVLAKTIAMDQWKERKKLQAVIDNLKLKTKELQDRIQDDERQKESLRKTINRLVNEKRVLEDKLRFKANDNERIHRLVEENMQWRIRFEGLEQRLREFSEEETNTDRHRLQISVLQERIIKQEQQMAQLSKSPTPPMSVNQSFSEEFKAKICHVKIIVTKLHENIQRLLNLVQVPRRPNGEKRITFQDGPPMSDIRKTVKTLHELVCQLDDIEEP